MSDVEEQQEAEDGQFYRITAIGVPTGLTSVLSFYRSRGRSGDGCSCRWRRAVSGRPDRRHRSIISLASDLDDLCRPRYRFEEGGTVEDLLAEDYGEDLYGEEEEQQEEAEGEDAEDAGEGDDDGSADAHGATRDDEVSCTAPCWPCMLRMECMYVVYLRNV